MALHFKALKLFRLLDILILAGGIAVTAAVSLAVYAGGQGAPEAVIGGSEGEWVYPLSRDAEVEIPGPLGSTWVHIEHGQVRIESSPCPNQTCVASAPISEPGQWIACLPNEVFVRIEARGGTDDATVDAVVQ
jgi:hypothetical protein